MKTLNLIFLVHEPRPLKHYTFFDIGDDHYYFDDYSHQHTILQACEECYIPTNNILLNIIKNSVGKVKVSFAISGTMLSRLEEMSPETIDSFAALAKTGSVEFMAMPYSYSLASLFDDNEFRRQVRLQADSIERLFGVRPVSFVNTSLIYTDTIGECVADLGFKYAIIENAKHVMGWKSPHRLYNHPNKNLRLLIRDNTLSDRLSLHFSNPSKTITAEQFAIEIATSSEEEESFNLVFGYDSFGLKNREDSGIFEFLKALPYYCLENQIEFSTPKEISKKIKPVEKLPILYPISWQGEEKSINAYSGNQLQAEALEKLYGIAGRVNMSADKLLLQDWYYLQDVQNLYAMSDDYCHYTPHDERQYNSIYQAFMNFMNIISDFKDRVKAQFPSSVEDEELNALLKTIRNQNDEINALKAEISRLKHSKK